MQKERRTVKRDQVIIMYPLNIVRTFTFFSRAIDNIMSLNLCDVLQILKPQVEKLNT